MSLNQTIQKMWQLTIFIWIITEGLKFIYYSSWSSGFFFFNLQLQKLHYWQWHLFVIYSFSQVIYQLYQPASALIYLSFLIPVSADVSRYFYDFFIHKSIRFNLLFILCYFFLQLQNKQINKSVVRTFSVINK